MATRGESTEQGGGKGAERAGWRELPAAEAVQAETEAAALMPLETAG